MEIFGLDDWLAWFLLGIGLLLTELLIGFTFYAAPVALGAFAAAIVAAFGDAIEPQLVAFILGSAASLLVLRPLVKKHLLPPPPDKRSNVQRMLGARAVARERVDFDSGTARLGHGQEVWSARTLSEDLVIEPGTVCEVVDVGGVYLYLEPHDESKPEPESGPAAAGEKESESL
jgi:membrane protein implicated in regulation of membrane protease activity